MLLLLLLREGRGRLLLQLLNFIQLSQSGEVGGQGGVVSASTKKVVRGWHLPLTVGVVEAEPVPSGLVSQSGVRCPIAVAMAVILLLLQHCLGQSDCWGRRGGRRRGATEEEVFGSRLNLGVLGSAVSHQRPQPELHLQRGRQRVHRGGHLGAGVLRAARGAAAGGHRGGRAHHRGELAAPAAVAVV